MKKEMSVIFGIIFLISLSFLFLISATKDESSFCSGGESCYISEGNIFSVQTSTISIQELLPGKVRLNVDGTIVPYSLMEGSIYNLSNGDAIKITKINDTGFVFDILYKEVEEIVLPEKNLSSYCNAVGEICTLTEGEKITIGVSSVEIVYIDEEKFKLNIDGSISNLFF